MTVADGDLFLGVDLSTQQLKGIVLNGNGVVVMRHAVNFSKNLPEFETSDGVMKLPDGSIVSPQHGTVYWANGAEEKLASLSSEETFYDGLGEAAFAVPLSPIWMDSTTAKQCASMEKAVDGMEAHI
ncbi:hypothetical protein Q1695_014099 [Nippostrongylus brasiliensis]|nr:hypothetical protein Q1695_014099 [Nippostrongylus brasiliensis]